ncbi:potassium channel subfamily K member 5-like isoform X2 [Notolabrus celidotus]|uniref:potassium channel subfamily K member 5-like isoform X2 n=1 Tax=Notolabrus celidotus TaxID=1203425 RepID=UPI001490707B|nr:potassium channel subfamily K member 5-like isoform X2 [Notolabrus celidotus]
MFPFPHEYLRKVVSEAAGQGVTITGEIHRNTWDWVNSVIFASTIVTTIGFGNVAPKTQGGRIFCILYGLCGIPLCLVWISQLGSFFGDRAKRLSGILIRKGVTVKRVQLICTALFLLWGLFVHLLFPPLVFMSVEGWSYLEGLYYSFITLTTVGFGDYVAGVNPNIDYPRLYRVFAELWIYMGLAWLSLFFSWNVHMVVEAHKVFKKKRHKHRHPFDEDPPSVEDKPNLDIKPTCIDIFDFPEDADYSTIIREIGASAQKRKPDENINRSKSCSDILGHNIQTLEHSPRHKRLISISDVFINAKAKVDKDGQKDVGVPEQESNKDPDPAEGVRMDQDENKNGSVFLFETEGIHVTLPDEPSPPQQKSMISISDVFINPKAKVDKDEQKDVDVLEQESNKYPDPAEGVRMDQDENKDGSVFLPETESLDVTLPDKAAAEEESVQHPDGGGTRFTISKVEERH